MLNYNTDTTKKSMPTKQTIGIPIVRISQNIQDKQVRRALDELAQETTRWLQRIAEEVDTSTGMRGEPRFHSAVNAQDNRITKVGIPKEATDAQLAGLSLGRASFNATHWDAKNMPILNLPTVSEDKTTATLTQEQIRALIAEEIRNLSDTLNAEPYVTVSASALLTAERRLAAEATVLELVDAGANSTLTINVLANGITNTKIRDSGALSVIGRSANSSGDPADIVAAANGNIFRRASDTIGFGQIDLADATNAVSGILTVPNGGSGAATLTGLLVGNGVGAFTAVTTSAGIAGQVSDETGSGALVFATSPTLITPVLGVASATSIGFGNEALDTYDEATFTATGTGFTVNPTGTAEYVRIGRIVLLFLPELTGTSNATTFTVTGMPAAIQPTNISYQLARMVDNGGEIIGLIELIAASSTINLYASSGGAAWTAAGTKTLYRHVIAYILT